MLNRVLAFYVKIGNPPKRMFKYVVLLPCSTERSTAQCLLDKHKLHQPDDKLAAHSKNRC